MTANPCDNAGTSSVGKLNQAQKSSLVLCSAVTFLYVSVVARQSRGYGDGRLFGGHRGVEQRQYGSFGAVTLLEQQDVDEIDCDKAAVGHDGLADKLESFCNRWQVGVANLVKDGDEVAHRLAEAVADYRATDEAIVQNLGGPVADA